MRYYIPVILILAGCQSGTAPEAALTSEVTVSPDVVAAGDTVHLLVAATNHGAKAVEPITGCGPGLEFEITRPDKTRIYPMRSLIFTCEKKDSHVLEPGETDTLRFAWRTPTARGRYSVRGGVRVGSRLGALSKAESFTVR